MSCPLVPWDSPGRGFLFAQVHDPWTMASSAKKNLAHKVLANFHTSAAFGSYKVFPRMELMEKMGFLY